MIPVGSSWPTEPNLLFGWRRSEDHVHQGVDLMAPEGTIVRASRSGTVVFVLNRYMPGWRGYGRLVVIAHDGGRTWELHAHLQKSLVIRGQRVTAGQAIGKVGVTRWDTPAMEEFNESGAHDHFEILTRFPPREERDRIDPIPFAGGGSLLGMLLGAALVGYAARKTWRR